MVEWLSSSLFRRMISTLLFGLVFAQALNRTIHLYQHRLMAEQASQVAAAQRVADMIRLFSALNPETKQAISEQYHSPSLRVIAVKKTSRVSRTGEPNDPKFKIFRSTLRDLLGNQQPAGIVIIETVPQILLLNIQLKDGSALILQTVLQHYQEEESPVLVHLVIILIAITGFSIVAVHWVTRPLQKLAIAAENLGQDIRSPPLEEDGPIEVRRAARAFNAMQANLVRHIEERTQLLAAISHDLKTPITRLRLRTELLDDDHLRARFQNDLDEMESMVMATLDFMRGVDRQEALQPVDLMALLESLQADALEMQESVSLSGSMQAPYWGKPTALKRCISNLLDNAFKYGYSASLSVEDSEDLCIIRVLDQGAGIPQEQLKKVFTPYYRLESSRNRDTGGTGLGLSIAKDIANLHGGHLILQNSEQGGLEAVLTLPRRKTDLA